MLKLLAVFLILKVFVGGNNQAPVSSPSPKTIRSREVIVVTGNFSVDGQLVNIAEYDIQQSRLLF